MRTIRLHAFSLKPVDWPDKAWKKIASDIVGEVQGLPQRYAIAVMDYHSKWPEVRLVSR